MFLVGRVGLLSARRNLGPNISGSMVTCSFDSDDQDPEENQYGCILVYSNRCQSKGNSFNT